MFGRKDSTEAAQQDDRQATLFPPDPAYGSRHEDNLQLRHYLIGGVLIAAMLGVLVTGYFYSRSLVIQEPKEDAATASTPPAAPVPLAAQPAPLPPVKKIETAAPPPPAPPAAKPTPKPESAAAKNIPAAKPEAAAPEVKAAAKPAAASTVYFIQLAAFKDPQETARLCKRIEPLGFSCYFGSVDTSDGRYWRLRVGPYEAKDKAEGDLARLQGKGFDGRVIPLRKSGVKAPIQLPL